MKRPASLVAAIFLLCLAVAQLCRAIFAIPIMAAGIEIPVWPSFFACIFLAALGVWVLKERAEN